MIFCVKFKAIEYIANVVLYKFSPFQKNCIATWKFIAKLLRNYQNCRAILTKLVLKNFLQPGLCSQHRWIAEGWKLENLFFKTSYRQNPMAELWNKAGICMK